MDAPTDAAPSPHPPADVPVNAGQRAAVAGLSGGLGIIHGPPGTGKSTTIFHIVEGRVQPKAQVGAARGAARGRCGGGTGRLLERRSTAALPPSTGAPDSLAAQAARALAATPQVLVTATRNQAIDAVVQKLSRVDGSLLVFGREDRLGPHARRYTLEERVKRHPHALAWLDRVEQLQALREGAAPDPASVAAVLRASLAQVWWGGSGWRAGR